MTERRNRSSIEDDINRKLKSKKEEKQQKLDLFQCLLTTEQYQAVKRKFDREISQLETELGECQQMKINDADGRYFKKPKQDDDRDTQSIAREVTVGGTSDSSIDGWYDFPSDDGQIHEHEVERIVEQLQKSPFEMAAQGLRPKSQRTESSVDVEEKAAKVGLCISSLEYNGKLFHKGRCYLYNAPGYKGAPHIIGVTGFHCKTTMNPSAACVWIVPFSMTFMGEDIHYMAKHKHSEYVEVGMTLDPLSLEHFGAEFGELKEIPDWVYEPQTKGSWYNFAYFKKTKRELRGLRGSSIHLMELFAGGGGMAQGFANNCGFETVFAIEHDEKAFAAYQLNHGKVAPHKGSDVTQVLRNSKLLKQIGPVEHIHGSPPCQEFSTANVYGNGDPKKRQLLKDLSLTWPEVKRRTTMS